MDVYNAFRTFVLVNSLLKLIAAEVFTSTSQLEDLIVVEHSLNQALQSYIEEENDRLNGLRRFLSQRRKEHEEYNAHGGIGNPATAFSILNQFEDDWRAVEENVRSSQHRSDLLDQLATHKDSFPSIIDFNGARKALLRLQTIYNISPRDLTHGKIPGDRRTIRVKLSAMDSFRIGRKAYKEGSNLLAKSWMENTISMMGTQDSLQDITGIVRRNEVLNHLAFLEYQTGNWSRALEYYHEMVQRDPEDVVSKNNIKEMEFLMEKANPQATVKTPSEPKLENETDAMVVYTHMCRQNNQARSPSNHPPLTCSYLNQHPGLILKPVAMETLNLEPRIILFHNVLSEAEIDGVLRLARPRLSRAGVNNLDTGKVELAEYRISKNAWLRNNDSELVRRINRRIGFITGLNTDTGEALQVNNYGVGGHYEPHFDHALDMSISPIAALGTGNRIATLLFYLSEVEAGGSTVFLEARVKANPKKGGAVFWYNLKRSGEGDWTTLHAGCPVLLGNKWVANKWLHEHGN